MHVELTNSLPSYVSEHEENLRAQFNFLAHTADIGTTRSAGEQVSLSENITEVRWFTKEELADITQNEFISHRAYELIQDFLANKIYPLVITKQVTM